MSSVCRRAFRWDGRPGLIPAILRSVVRHVLGWAFLIVGIAGLVLPVLQGWLFIAIGALLLSPDVPIFARFLTWIENRFPVLRSAIGTARRRVAGREKAPEPPPEGT